jgi:hypothetical protein
MTVVKVVLAGVCLALGVGVVVLFWQYILAGVALLLFVLWILDEARKPPAAISMEEQERRRRSFVNYQISQDLAERREAAREAMAQSRARVPRFEYSPFSSCRSIQVSSQGQGEGGRLNATVRRGPSACTDQGHGLHLCGDMGDIWLPGNGARSEGARRARGRVHLACRTGKPAALTGGSVTDRAG